MHAPHFLFFTSLFLPLCNAANCYLPSGAQLNSTVTYQCPTNGAFQGSMCCQSMDPFGASGADKCVEVGGQAGSWLCLNDDGSLWRRGCSDRTWKSSGCVSVCANLSSDNDGTVWGDLLAPITVCSDGSYCCGLSIVGTPCCNSKQGFFIFNGTEVKENPSPTSPDESSVTTTTTTRNSLASGNATCPTGGKQAAENKSPEQNNDSEMVKKNTAIGAAVGGALGGAAFLGIAQFFIFRSIFRRKLERGLSGTGTRIHQPPQGDTDKGLALATTVYSGHENRPPLPEVDGTPHTRHELLGGGQL